MVDPAEAAGRSLAHRHEEKAEPPSSSSLLNFAESPRDDDWTLRSALVRLAQPEPTRAGAVLELVRRCGTALQPLASTIDRHSVRCDRFIGLDQLLLSGPDQGPADDTYPDGRTVDLARVCADAPDRAAAFLAGYRAEVELEADEEQALPLLSAVLRLDSLGYRLAAWALLADEKPPVDEVDATCSVVFGQLEELGVPRESAPPGRGRPAG